jgi:hypothetical protein
VSEMDEDIGIRHEAPQIGARAGTRIFVRIGKDRYYSINSKCV